MGSVEEEDEAVQAMAIEANGMGRRVAGRRVTVGLGVVLASVCGLARTASAQVGHSGTDASAGQAAGSEAVKAVPARSARLSYLADGVVLVGRSGENDTFPAQTNMALAQGSRVTSESGEAEIEFEDGSVARLTPNSAVNLDSLSGDASGYATTLRVLSGLVYLEMRASGVSRFRVVAGGDAFTPVENATVRVKLDDSPAVFSVLDGRIRVERGDGDGGYRTDVRAGESLRSDVKDGSRYFLSESVAPETWDQWNEARDQAAADQIASSTSVREGFAGGQGYGWADLDANGTWYGAEGQTPVWQPAEALAVGFDPYGYGSFTYFPGAGYAWASGYGWGWTPYRCGSWRYWNGFGWGWQPDSFCGGPWRFGGGINVLAGPRGYVAIGVPIRRPSGVHPIVPGPHGGERPPLIRGPREAAERSVAGVVMHPIRPAGFGVTPRGGSAVGASLRRDFPVDARTHTAVMGSAAGSGEPAQPSGVVSGWRSVSAGPGAPVGSVAGGAGVTRREPRAASGEASRRFDLLATPRVAPVGPGAGRVVSQRPPAQGVTERSQPAGSVPVSRPPQSQPALQMHHVQPIYQPRVERSVAAPPAPAVHSAPAAAPAAAAGKK